MPVKPIFPEADRPEADCGVPKPDCISLLDAERGELEGLSSALGGVEPSGAGKVLSGESPRKGSSNAAVVKSRTDESGMIEIVLQRGQRTDFPELP